MKLIIVCIVILVLAVVAVLGFMDLNVYKNIELEGAFDRALALIEILKQDLTYTINMFFIQMAYTEYLNGVLDYNEIDRFNYEEFNQRFLFRGGELDDPSFLRDNALSLQMLLVKARQKQGVILGEDKDGWEGWTDIQSESEEGYREEE